ncbi:MAG: 2-oxo acid dehydrogenase subunit E2 [Planctomycetes bacterium]|nr:2-oxo acid dehydrogenase subunit E2 [Planctomycetota bacterium]
MEFNLPEIGEGVYEAELSRWLVKPGDKVKAGQGLVEVLTDKATMEVPAPFAGTIDALRAEEGNNLKVGQAILSYIPAGGVKESVASTPAIVAKTPAKAAAVQVAAPALSDGNGATTVAATLPVKAAPSVRLMARKLGIDIGSVRGSGPEGRILVEDLSRRLQAKDTASAKRQAPLMDYGKPGTKIKLQGLRRKIAEHMVHATHTIPHYTYVDECDVSDLVRLRDSLREPLAAKGVKITYLAFFVKAVVGALKEVPIVNASLDDQAGEIVLHDRYNIGIAVATPSGLIVPVVQNADKRDLVDVARDIERLGNQTRDGKTKLEDLRGGTFTITSIGNLGGLFATPIIHHPQLGILGVGKITRRPVFDDRGQVTPADMLYLSLSFDHRVLDGAVGTAFGNAIIKRLRNPAVLLID